MIEPKKNIHSTQWVISDRPRVLSEVYGNDITIKSLKQKFASKKVPNTFLLQGASGTGKTTIAKIIAKSIVCTNPDQEGNPCCQCEECKAVEKETYDKSVYRLNGGTEGSVDAFKDGSALFEFKTSAWGGKRVVLVEEFQGLSGSAKEALLLDLETPNSDIYYILTTTGVSGAKEKKTFDIIKSRLCTYTFEPLNAGKLMLCIKAFCEKKGIWDKVKNPTEVIKYIAENSNGSIRDALNTFQTVYEAEAWTYEEYSQLVSGGSGEVKVYEILSSVVKGEHSQKIMDYFETLENTSAFSDARMIHKILSDVVCYSVFKKVPGNNYYANQTASDLQLHLDKVKEMLKDIGRITKYDTSKFDMIVWLCFWVKYPISTIPDSIEVSSETEPKQRLIEKTDPPKIRRKLIS